MKKKNILLIGAGGHCKVVIDSLFFNKQYKIYGIVDKKEKMGKKILGIPVVGTDDDLAKIFKRGVKLAFISVGSIGDCSLRTRLFELARKAGFGFPVIIHPDAVVARDVHIGEGSFIAAGAVVNPGTKIGRNAIINTSSSIDHDCLIEDFVHIAPGAVLSGGVKVGRYTHVGTGAQIIQNIRIGNNSMIGAGATVRHDVKDKQKFVDL